MVLVFCPAQHVWLHPCEHNYSLPAFIDSKMRLQIPCSYIINNKGSWLEVRGQRSRGPINVINTPENKGRGHRKEHDLRLARRHVQCPQGWSIIEWANQSAVCACVRVSSPHACFPFTRVWLPRQHRLLNWRGACLIRKQRRNTRPIEILSPLHFFC